MILKILAFLLLGITMVWGFICCSVVILDMLDEFLLKLCLKFFPAFGQKVKNVMYGGEQE